MWFTAGYGWIAFEWVKKFARFAKNSIAVVVLSDGRLKLVEIEQLRMRFVDGRFICYRSFGFSTWNLNDIWKKTFLAAINQRVFIAQRPDFAKKLYICQNTEKRFGLHWFHNCNQMWFFCCGYCWLLHQTKQHLAISMQCRFWQYGLTSLMKITFCKFILAGTPFNVSSWLLGSFVHSKFCLLAAYLENMESRKVNLERRSKRILHVTRNLAFITSTWEQW